MKKVFTVQPFICSVFFLLSCPLFAQQQKISTAEYIETYQATAIQEMQTYKIPASITIAQGIVESNSGNSDLAVYANNHFGIKCKAEWTGEKYYHDDDAKDECFRKYKSAAESYRDHSLFLIMRDRYAFLFKLDITDYKGWAYGLKQAGYATEPKYAEMLIKTIEENKLYELDGGKLLTIAPTPNDSIAAVVLQQIRDSIVIQIHDDKPDFGETASPEGGRTTEANNEVRFIHARQGDTYGKIATDFGLTARDVASYNDYEDDHIPVAGEVIYIEPKKDKAAIEFHTVIAGETMHDIAQKYAIKLKSLYRKNLMKQGTEPNAGQKLYLQQKAPVY